MISLTDWPHPDRHHVALNYTFRDHCPLDANVRERLSVNKPASLKFDVKRSDIKKTSEGVLEKI